MSWSVNNRRIKRADQDGGLEGLAASEPGIICLVSQRPVSVSFSQD